MGRTTRVPEASRFAHESDGLRWRNAVRPGRSEGSARRRSRPDPAPERRRAPRRRSNDRAAASLSAAVVPRYPSRYEPLYGARTMNLAHTLTQAALKWPDKTAHAFRAAGVGKGDRVAILTFNLPEQVTAFYGLMKIGAIPVPINYRLAANEVKYIVDDCRARILMFEEALRAPVEAIKDQIGVEKIVYVGAKPS